MKYQNIRGSFKIDWERMNSSIRKFRMQSRFLESAVSLRLTIHQGTDDTEQHGHVEINAQLQKADIANRTDSGLLRVQSRCGLLHLLF
jgi:hypothetical protein